MVVFRESRRRGATTGGWKRVRAIQGLLVEVRGWLLLCIHRAATGDENGWLSIPIGSPPLHTLRTKQNARRGALTTSSRRSRRYTRAHKRFALAACARKAPGTTGSESYTQKKRNPSISARACTRKYLTAINTGTQSWPPRTTRFPQTTRPRPSPRRPSSSSSYGSIGDSTLLTTQLGGHLLILKS